MDEFMKNVRYELPNENMFVSDDERLFEANKIKLSNGDSLPRLEGLIRI